MDCLYCCLWWLFHATALDIHFHMADMDDQSHYNLLYLSPLQKQVIGGRSSLTAYYYLLVHERPRADLLAANYPPQSMFD